jgi:hypothetical protein
MSLADGLGKAAPTAAIDGQVFLLDLVSIRTLAADETLTAGDRQIQVLDPAAARDVTLPAAAAGLWFLIVNDSSEAMGEDITVDDGTSDLAVIANDQACLFWCDGTSWYAVVLFTTTSKIPTS